MWNAPPSAPLEIAMGSSTGWAWGWSIAEIDRIFLGIAVLALAGLAAVYTATRLIQMRRRRKRGPGNAIHSRRA